MKETKAFIFTKSEVEEILRPHCGEVEVSSKGVTYVAHSKKRKTKGYASWDIDTAVAKHLGQIFVEGFYIGKNGDDEDEYAFFPVKLN